MNILRKCQHKHFLVLSAWCQVGPCVTMRRVFCKANIWNLSEYHASFELKRELSKRSNQKQRNAIVRSSPSGLTLETQSSYFGQVTSTSMGFVKVDLYEPGSVALKEGRLHPVHSNYFSEHPGEVSRIPVSSPNFDKGEDATTSGLSHIPVSTSLPRQQLLCNLRSILRKLGKMVLVGDQVCVRCVDWEQGRATVEDVLQRTSELVDPAIANVDHALLVFALDSPPFEELQVTKFLVSMEASGLSFTLVLNKIDLVEEAEVARRVQQVRSWGYEPLLVSCETGLGLSDALEVLSGRTSVVAGPSGAGKSSLINALRMGRHRPDQQTVVLTPIELDHRPDQQTVVLTPTELDAALSQALPRLMKNDEPERAAIVDTISAASTSTSSCRNSQVSETAGFHKKGVNVLNGESAESADSVGAEAIRDVAQNINMPRTRPARRQADENDKGGFLVVGEMSKMGRGKHTTTSAKLIRLPGGGLLADTPGFSQPSLSQITCAQLESLFPEMAAVVAEEPCRFSNCAHMLEPDCSINCRAGALERYPLYVKMYLEIKTREESDVKALQMAKHLREGGGKIKSGRGGAQRLEAKLDPKKHRTTSRQKSRLGLLQSLDE
ncbi:hypothetical protein CEUSTIGMA_g247.t1 [Chlamydomonas eustigma]|uniref:EngC GTPase domain-containing protein n=1 Tax=Chlamydomonas eustigma TaxID=1157962 RepID=A0A250WQ55_9CHLO|nr:hypothetical protein CEUSTIGMA_g247.t1 [Chlamydomonas eustigma]|eukprot:GAX72792.1 hypothetical protein CEUSTIGMA_g247.t1 [Chlamydomonas eustigma]